MTVKALIFDYFGVISADGYELIKHKGLLGPEPGAKYDQLSDRVNMGQISWPDFLQALAQESGKSLEQVSAMYSAHKLDVKLLHKIANLKNRYKTALLTNANSEYIRPILLGAGLNPLFDEIIISSEVGVVKPSAEIYTIAVEKLGVQPSEAVMIDDLTRNVNGAIHAGLQAIEYKNLQQLQADLSKIDIEL